MEKSYQEWSRFLGRPPIAIDHDAIHRMTEGKRILVSGRGLQEISRSIEEHDVGALLNAIQSAVPEYHPGALLQSRIEISSKREVL